MARKPDKETLMLMKEQIQFLKKSFLPEKILLFGSRARGDHLEESDLDIIVVSDKFENIPFRERIIKAYGFWNKRQNLEIICYTPEEFERLKKEISLIKNAIKEGIELK